MYTAFAPAKTSDHRYHHAQRSEEEAVLCCESEPSIIDVVLPIRISSSGIRCAFVYAGSMILTVAALPPQQ